MIRSEERLESTTSLCPECLERVPGYYEERDGSVHLTRTCDEHGTASHEVWGSVDHWEWAGGLGSDFDFDGDAEFTVGNDHACLAVVEVTQDCNLSCSFCFASSGPGGKQLAHQEVVDLLETVKAGGGPRPIQFSGGEPTVREDLPELVETAVEMGFEHIQVNTNGVKLAHQEGYARRLADAGVTAVYLQFDGLEAETYEEIRDAAIAEEKHAALEHCREAGLSVVLVPTVVPGTNDHEMGDIVRFALENLDVVESVNFQPVAQFGRYEDHGSRYSMDRAAGALAEQVDTVDARDFLPIPCCSSYCQMATVLLPADDGPAPLTDMVDASLFDELSGTVDESDWMELLASTKAGKQSACDTAGCCSAELPPGAGELLDRTLPVSFTGFMDANAADAGRLSNCCVSVPTPSGELVPFCAYNMTNEDGEYAIRNRNGWGGRDHVDGVAVDADVPVEVDGGTELTVSYPTADGTDANGADGGEPTGCGPDADCCGGE
jgi:uncharacterized radical SAM superfamily Fe-S cluster-containing enzyme